MTEGQRLTLFIVGAIAFIAFILIPAYLHDIREELRKIRERLPPR